MTFKELVQSKGARVKRNYYFIAPASEEIGCSERFLKRAIREGQVHAVPFGQRLVVSAAEVERVKRMLAETLDDVEARDNAA